MKRPVRTEEPAHRRTRVPATPFDVLGRSEGDALCPMRFDVTKLEEIQRQLGGYAFLGTLPAAADSG